MPNYTARGPEQLANIAKIVSGLSLDKPWRITIAPYRETRSLEANDRFHALIAEIASDTGNDPKWLKEWVKDEFGPRISVEVAGKVHSVPKPSRNYTVEEMTEVMTRLEAFASSELGITL